MPVVNEVIGDLNIRGRVTAQSITLPSSSVGNSQIAAGAGVAASKLEGEFKYNHSQTGNVANATEYFNAVRGTTGEIVAIEMALTETIPSGDKTVTIDLQKSTGAGAFATVLSGTVVLNSSSVLRTLVAGTISSGDLADGDILKLTVTIGGSTGTDPQGLVVTVILREDA